MELNPPSGDTRALATALSDEVNGTIYISGTSAAATSSRALRWRVNITTSAVTLEELDVDTESQDVSNSGSQTVRAFFVAAQRNFPRLWSTDGIFALHLPENSISVSAVSISKNGKYVVGNSLSGGVRPVLWTAR